MKQSKAVCSTHTHTVLCAVLGLVAGLLLFSNALYAGSPNPSTPVASNHFTSSSIPNPYGYLSYAFPYHISSDGKLVIDNPSTEQGNSSPIVSFVNSNKTNTNACYANSLIGSNINVTTDGTVDYPVSETSIVKSETNIIIGFNDTYDYLYSNSMDGYAYSLDGGKTFVDAGATPIGNIRWLLGDPSLAVDAAHNVYYASLASNGSAAFVTLSKSTDNGVTFGNPSIVIAPSSSSYSFDKEMMAIDTIKDSPYKNNIYISYSDFYLGQFPSIEFVRSVDGGNSFSSPLVLSQIVGSGPMPAVGPGGVIYVAWADWPISSNYPNNHNIWIAKSTDGGQTFSSPVRVGNVNMIGLNTAAYTYCSPQPALNGNIRVNDFPSIAVDTSSGVTQGNIYVVWNSQNSNGYSDVMLSRSTDGEATWESPIRVNDNTTNTDSFMPWVTVNPTGKVTVMWYDRRNDPTNNLLIDVYEAISYNGGVSFEPNIRVTCQSFTPAPTNPPHSSKCYMGDYNQLMSDLTKDYSVWGDSLTGGQNVYFATTDLLQYEWTQFHDNPARTGYNNFISGEIPKPFWAYQTGGAVESSPAILGTNIFIGSDDGNVYWFDATTGNLITKWKTNGAVTSSPAVSIADTGVPVVYVGSQDGKVYALSWIIIPLIAWSYQTGGAINSSPALVGTYDNGTIYIGSSDTYLYALDTHTGSLKWRWSPHLANWGVTFQQICIPILWFQICIDFPIITYTPTPINSSPAVDVANSRVYFTVSKYVYALSTGGAYLWRRTLSSTTSSSPSVDSDNDIVMVGSDDGTIYGLNGSNGSVLWSHTTGGAIVSTPAVHNGIVYVSSMDGKIYYYNEVTGSFIASTSPAVGPIEGSIALNDVGLSVGSDDGKIYAFQMWGGMGYTMVTTTGAIKSSPAFTPLYFAVGDDNGIVFGGRFSPPCAAAVTADPTQTSELDTIRAFRDKDMGQGKEGKGLIEAYDKYTPEVAWIISTNSDIRQRAQSLLGEAITVITAYQNNDGNELDEQMTQEQVEQLYQFAESIKALTDDQSLKDSLTSWERDDLSRWKGMPFRAIINEIKKK